MRARANPGALAKVRALMAAGSAAAVDDPEELHAAGLPRALPGGLASDAIHQRAKLLWYTLQQRQHSNSGSVSSDGGGCSACMPPCARYAHDYMASRSMLLAVLLKCTVPAAVLCTAASEQ